MRDRNRPGLFVAVLFLLLCAAPIQAQEPPADNPLLDLLAYVPAAGDYRDFVSYGDLALWNESWGIDRVDDLDELEQRSDIESEARDVQATLFVMTRQTGAPEVVAPSYLLFDDSRGYFGVDLLNTDRFIEAGNPPDVLTVIETADIADVPMALAASGYEESTLGEAVLFSKGEDFEVNLQERDIPTVAQLAGLNRVALLEDAVIIGRATAIVEDALNAAAGETPTLADDPIYRAGALAVSDPALVGDGALVGAIFMGQAELFDLIQVRGSRATPEQIEALREALDIGVGVPGYDPPGYDLAVFASRRRADDSQLLLALVFPPGVDAQSATDALLMRMKRYTSLRTNQPLVDLWSERGLDVEWGRGREIGGLPVGLVSISVRNPSFEDDENGRMNTYMFSWQDMVYARDLGFMAVTEE